MKTYLKAPKLVSGLAVIGFVTEAVAIFFSQLKFDFLMMLFYLATCFVFLYKSKSETSPKKIHKFIRFIKPKFFPIAGGLTALFYFFRCVTAITNDSTADGGAVFAVIIAAALIILPHCLCIVGTIKDNRKLIKKALIALAVIQTLLLVAVSLSSLFIILYKLISQIILIAIYVVGYLFIKDDNFIKTVSQLDSLKTDHSKGTMNDSEYDEAVRTALADL